jgi:hypothetical protein
MMSCGKVCWKRVVKERVCERERERDRTVRERVEAKRKQWRVKKRSRRGECGEEKEKKESLVICSAVMHHF